MSNERQFIFLIDGLRHDYVTAGGTPFLHHLKEKSLHAVVEEPLFADAELAYSAGPSASNCGSCFAFDFDPQHSPFSFLKRLAPLCKFFESLRCDGFFRGSIRRHAEGLEESKGSQLANPALGTAFVPLHLLPFFRPRRAIQSNSIFDALTAHGTTCNTIAAPEQSESTETTLQRYAAAPDAQVAFIRFSEVGQLGTQHGPKSAQVAKSLRKIDAAVRRLLEPAENGIRAIIFGTYGLVEVTSRIDLRAALGKLPFQEGKDYVPFIEDTRALFWFPNPKSRSAVEGLLSGVTQGRILSEEELQKNGIRRDAAHCGEIFFALAGGAAFSPSFTSPLRSLPKGLHGNLREVADSTFQLIATAPQLRSEDLGKLPMTQIYSIIRDNVIPPALRV
ncbi:MAG: alkaline phosphatase family protein [Deltaproteobacteria bacterium]|nr:alkaline phosphatase family protein [Deltaproteobacteria bacterium]